LGYNFFVFTIAESEKGRWGGAEGRRERQRFFAIDAGDTKDSILSCENTLRFAEER